MRTINSPAIWIISLILFLQFPNLHAQLEFVTWQYDHQNSYLLEDLKDMIFSPDGQFAYLASSGDNALVLFEKDPITGGLTFKKAYLDELDVTDGLGEVRSIVISTDGRHLYAVARNDKSITLFERDLTTGLLELKQLIYEQSDDHRGLRFPQDVVLSPDGKHLVVMTNWHDAISVFERNEVTGELTFLSDYIKDTNGIVGLNDPESMQFSPDGQFLYLISGQERGVVIFERNPDNGVLNFVDFFEFGSLETPYAQGMSSDGKFYYVSFTRRLMTFARDENSGLLVQVQDLAYPFPINYWLRSFVLHPDDSKLYVGEVNSDQLRTYDRDLLTGLLTLQDSLVQGIDGTDGVVEIVEMTISPDGNFLYTLPELDFANFTQNGGSAEIGIFEINETTGAPTFLTKIENPADVVNGLDLPIYSLFSPDEQFLYVAANEEEAISVFKYDPEFGDLEFVQAVVHGLDGVEQMQDLRSFTISPDGKHLYACAQADNSVVVFDRDAQTGMLTYKTAYYALNQTLTELIGSWNAVVSNDGKQLYVVSYFAHTLVVFDRNETTGLLTHTQTLEDNENGVDGLWHPNQVLISPDDRYIYVSSSEDDAVTVFNRNIANGQLTFLGMVQNEVNGVLGLETPQRIAFSPNAEHLYATGYSSNSLAAFSRNPNTGSLTFIEHYQDDSLGVDGLDQAFALRVSPDGTRVYASSLSEDALTVFERDATTGKLIYLEHLNDGVDGANAIDNLADFAIPSSHDFVFTMGFRDDAIGTYFTGTTVDVNVFKCPENSYTFQFAHQFDDPIDTSFITRNAQNELRFVNLHLENLELDISILPPDLLDCVPDDFVKLTSQVSSNVVNTGGTISYEWTGPSLIGVQGFDCNFADAPGTYCVEVTHQKSNVSCSKTICVEVVYDMILPQQPTFGNDNVICANEIYTNFCVNNFDPEATGYIWTTSLNTPIQTDACADYQLDTIPIGNTVEVCVEATNLCGVSPQTCELVEVTAPTALFSGGGDLCAGGGAIDLVIELTGNAPWELLMSQDGNFLNYTVTTSPFILTVDEPGIYILHNIFDANNCSESIEQTVVVGGNSIPTATLSGDGSICSNNGEMVDLSLTLTGQAPWDLTILHNGNSAPLIVNLNPFTLTVTEPGIYELLSVTDANGCDGTVVGMAIIEENESPTAQIFNSPATVCVGESVSLPVVLTGTAPWIVTWQQNGVPMPPLTINFSPFDLILTDAGVVELIEVTDASGCIGMVSGWAEIELSPPLVFSIFETTCNATADAYVLTFEIGGIPPFFVEPLVGTISDTAPYLFTSYEIPSGEGLSFDILDGNGCTNFVSQASMSCQCASQAGAMDPMLMSTCGDGLISATYFGGETLDANDVLKFVLHNGSGNSLGTSILGISDSPSFAFAPTMMVYSTVYYISAVVGNDDGNGEVDLNDPCLSVSFGTPIIFQELPTAAFLTADTSLCDTNTSVDLEVAFTGEAPWSFTWGDGGTTFNVSNVMTSTAILSVVPSATTTYQIFEINDANCVGNILNNVTISIDGGIMIQSISNDTTICEGEEVQLDIMTSNSVGYQWSPVANLSCTDCQNPIATPENNTNYTVLLTDNAGCTASASVQIFVQCFEVYDTIPIGGISLQSLNLPPWEVVAPADICDNEWAEHTSFGFFPNNSGLFYVGLSVGMDTLCVLLEHEDDPSISEVFTFYITVTEEDLTMLQGGGIEEFQFNTNSDRSVISNGNVIENSIELFPNPTTDFLYLHSEKAEIQSIEVYDIAGQLRMKYFPNTFQTSIPTYDLLAGSYFLKIETAVSIVIRKVVVLK